MRLPKKKISLPQLHFLPTDLSPVISAKTLEYHYLGHHKSYIKKFNELLENGGDREALSFNYFGHILHSLYWSNLAPFQSTVLEDPLLSQVKNRFGSEQGFYDELINHLLHIEGSGWTLLLKDSSNKIYFKNIANHDCYAANGCKPLLVADGWEHAYYLDYQNNKKIFFENFTYVIDWDKVNQRFMS